MELFEQLAQLTVGMKKMATISHGGREYHILADSEKKVRFFRLDKTSVMEVDQNRVPFVVLVAALGTDMSDMQSQ